MNEEAVSVELFSKRAMEFKKELQKPMSLNDFYSLWRNTSFPYKLKNQDPFSQEYKAEVLKLYEMLCETNYDTQNELTSVKQKPEDFGKGFPWVSGHFGTGAAEIGKTAQALKALQESAPDAKRIIEFGSGWGNLSIPLARLGKSVTCVDIDEGFLNRTKSEAAAVGAKIEIINKEFIDAAESLVETYDVVIFQSSFHHCLDFVRLTELLREKVVASSGCVLFLSEPISNGFTFPWGLRYDGESIWAITCNHWLELGFSEDFFKEFMARSGFSLSIIPALSGLVGPGWVATPVAHLAQSN